MNAKDTGKLIRKLRTEKGLTQAQLSEKLMVSDKTVSKWERGLGSPDVSILPAICDLFDLPLENLLSGKVDENEMNNGNLKKMKFYACPVCGNLIFSTDAADLSCCGKKLTELTPRKAEGEQKLVMERADDIWEIHADHEQSRDHYISYIAVISADSFFMKKLYPEWGVDVRLPYLRHGMLVHYDTKDGLFYQKF